MIGNTEVECPHGFSTSHNFGWVTIKFSIRTIHNFPYLEKKIIKKKRKQTTIHKKAITDYLWKKQNNKINK